MRKLGLALALAFGVFAAGNLAGAATGGLGYKGCVTGDQEAACSESPTATPGGYGEESGLDNLQFVALSADGKSLYAASLGDSAVTWFKRNQRTGALTFRACITGETESGPGGSGACEQVPAAAPSGESSGLDGLISLVLSGDGKSLYATSEGDDAVARFKRNRRTGALTYKACITGETESGPGGSGACEEVPAAASSGESSGLDGLQSVALTADGKVLYTASGGDDAVARFGRNRQTGALTFRGCTTGESETGPSGSDACKEVPAAASDGSESGLDSLRSVALSGSSLYTASGDDAAVAWFKRNGRTGALTFKGCITGEAETGPGGSDACKEIPAASSAGADSGLFALTSLRPGGRSLYASSDDDDAVARFKRDRRTGALKYKGCITGEAQSGPGGSGACKRIATAAAFGENSGLDNVESLTLSPDGKSLYSASGGDSAVARFRRNPRTGALTYKRCITGDSESGPGGSGACRAIPAADIEGQDSGLADLEWVTVSTEGKSVYAAAGDDAAVAHFKRKR